MVENGQNFKLHTAHNAIHLVEHRGRLELRGKDKSLQSVINLQYPERLELANLEHLVSVMLFIPPPERILMLGTAAGSLLHFLRHHYPRAQITCVDIDGELIDHLLQIGILPPADERLDYVYADAAHYIAQPPGAFDLVVCDIFDGLQTPPWMLSKETLASLHHLLGEHGALAFNLVVDSDYDFGQFYRELRRIFHQQTLSLPVADLENRVVYAIRGKVVARDLSANMQLAAEMSTRLDIDLMHVLSVIYNCNPVGSGDTGSLI